MALLSPAFEKRSVSLSPKDPALAELWNGPNSASGQNVTSDTAMSVAAVYACTQRISKTLAMLPLNVMRKTKEGGHEIATNHRCHDLVNFKPNPWQTSYDWRLFMQTCFLLRGNGYSEVIYNPGRKQNELVPMHPDRVWPFVVTPNGSILYMYDNSPPPPAGSKLFYQYFPTNDGSRILEADEVFHIKGVSNNGIVGRNVVSLMREAIGLSMATEEHGARLFANGAQISKIFTHPSKLNDITYDRLKSELAKNFSGVQNSHKTIIIEDGMKVENISMTNEDAQFLLTRQFELEEIASFIDVPLMLINRSGDKNLTFASAEQILSMFVTLQMNPHYVMWEQQLQKTLLFPNEYGEYYFDFDTDAIMRGDAKSRSEYYKNMFSVAGITPDEIRGKEHMSPLENGAGKKPYILNQMVPLEMAGQNVTTKTSDTGASDAGISKDN